MNQKNFISILLLLNISACSITERTIEAKDHPNPKYGYIGGLFTKNEGAGMGISISNTGTGREYLLPFGKDTSTPSYKLNEFSVIQVPAGKYKLKSWETYIPLTKEIITHKDISDTKMATEFEVRQGQVILIGHYTADDLPSAGYSFQLKKTYIPAEGITFMFERDFKNFSDLEISCPLC